MGKEITLLTTGDNITTLQVIPNDQPTAAGDPYVIPRTIMEVEQPVDVIPGAGSTDLVPTGNSVEGGGSLTFEITGLITDKNGATLDKVTVCMTNSAGNQVADPFTVNTGVYNAWSDDPTKIYLTFKRSGYSSKKALFSDLMQDPNITLQQESIPWWMILAVVAAVAAYRKRSKKVGKLSTQDLLPVFMIAGGLIAFSVIKRILVTLGIWTSQDTKDLDNAAENPNSFWNPNYWRTIKPSYASYSYTLTDVQAAELCRQLNNCFSWYNDDEDTAIGIFKNNCRTKANCSFIAYVWNYVYGSDLLTFLRGGYWPQDRLSDDDVNNINQFISKLPNY